MSIEDKEQEAKYVLLHAPTGNLFREQNLYLGQALLTDEIEEAAKLTLDDAENAVGRMKHPGEWKIWSVRTGLILDEESERHIIRNKREELQKQLDELPQV